MATATLSQDNTYRIDLRITVRASIGELASYLASATRNTQFEQLPTLTARQARDLTRDELERRGTDFIDGWSGQFGETETAERLAWATDQIRRAFPELAKAEDSRRVQMEHLVTNMCNHGNTPRTDVTGDPITECAAGSGGTDWGAFNDEGCFYAYDCAVDVANEAAKEAEEQDGISWGRKCREHDDQPHNGCTECYAE